MDKDRRIMPAGPKLTLKSMLNHQSCAFHNAILDFLDMLCTHIFSTPPPFTNGKSFRTGPIEINANTNIGSDWNQSTLAYPLASHHMYECMYVWMYECMNVWMYVCMYECMYVCMYECICECMYACMNVWMYVYMYVWYECMNVWMYECMNVCMHACMHACMYVCMYVCMDDCTVSHPQRDIPLSILQWLARPIVVTTISWYKTLIIIATDPLKKWNWIHQYCPCTKHRGPRLVPIGSWMRGTNMEKKQNKCERTVKGPEQV